MAVRLGASLFLGGALITVAAVLLPHPDQADETGYLGMAAAQALCALILLCKPAGLSDRLLPGFVTVSGIAAVTASVYFNGERLGGPPLFNEFFYLWPALYAGYFFKPRALGGALALTAAAYGAVLALINVHGQLAVTRWTVATTSVAGLAVAAHVLRLQRDRLIRRLRQAVRTDPLTTVLNRLGFEEAFERELDRLARTGSPLAVLVGDLDHFKALNDRYGHAAGDGALAAVGGVLRGASRTVDSVARIGGEEFALLLPATGPAGAFEAAERFRRAVSKILDPGSRPLTISFGLVTCEKPGASADELMAAADEALYAAKAQGRNRTVVAGPALAVAV